MKRIFVDTGAWDAIADRNDACHKSAIQFQEEIAGQSQLYVTNYVLDELYTLMLMNVGHQATVEFKRKLDIMINVGILELVWVSEIIAADAWEVFERFNTDKRWSFTDCTSYVVMQRLGITDVFAFDHHFEQMGFNRQPSLH